MRYLNGVSTPREDTYQVVGIGSEEDIQLIGGDITLFEVEGEGDFYLIEENKMTLGPEGCPGFKKLDYTPTLRERVIARRADRLLVQEKISAVNDKILEIYNDVSVEAEFIQLEVNFKCLEKKRTDLKREYDNLEALL